MLDKFLAVAEYKGISSVIVFTKTDKYPADEYLSIYSGIYPVFCVDNEKNEIALQAGESVLLPATTQEVTIVPDKGVKLLETYV